MTSLELRKLIIKLRNEDQLTSGDISKTVGKSKSVIEESVSREAKKPPTAREDRWIGNESKKDRFATAIATTIFKGANANLGI